MKPKSNRKPDETGALDKCQTPPYALTPLLPYLPKNSLIWESAAGEGYMARALRARGYRVVENDITYGHDFFAIPSLDPDVIQVTNPPYSKKALWIAQSYIYDTPFALLVPTETLSRMDVQNWTRRYGLEIMLLDRRIDFKMPSAGWKSSAQFPVIWLCHRLLPVPVVYGHVSRQEVDDWKRIHGIKVAHP